MKSNTRLGLAAMLGCFLIWGFQPLYFSLCGEIDTFFLMASRVIWAAICAGFGKLFGKRGVFYEMVGQEVAGLDGFYDHCFDVYGEFGIRIPENSDGVCEEVYRETGIRMMIVDANDLAQELLGKCAAIQESEADLKIGRAHV